MEEIIAKPFLKWAGGKTKLLTEIKKNLPPNLNDKKMTYIEPFLGSGAVLFWIVNNYTNIDKIIINDINADLINAYNVIVLKAEELIGILKRIETEYHSLENNTEKKKEYYYSSRKLFNSRKSNKTLQAALFIFLNRTCFNGLYRVNRNNMFNVPIGSYVNPKILDAENLLSVSNKLKNVRIISSDFSKTNIFANKDTFFYIDPPYRALEGLNSFHTYSQYGFSESEHIRLSNFCDALDKLGAKWMLSSSDLEYSRNNKIFFEKAYKKYNIVNVKVAKYINPQSNNNKTESEVLILNY